MTRHFCDRCGGELKGPLNPNARYPIRNAYGAMMIELCETCSAGFQQLLDAWMDEADREMVS